jgi:hypothetical protein
MKDLGKELKQDFTLNDKDKNIIEALKREPVYQKAFADMSKDLSEKLKNAVIRAYDDPKGFSINNLVNQMKDNTDAIESDLRRIARTESSKISIAARKTQYDKTGENYLVKHIGVKDDRTGKDSIELMDLTKNGVTWEKYLELAKQISQKYNPRWVINEQAPLLHPNQRSIPAFFRNS